MAHTHQHDQGASERRVFWVMVLTFAFMIVEAVGGLMSGSLALLADAGHMLTDACALALAWFAFRIARKPSDPQRTFGYHRFQVLAAFTNALALIAIALWIFVEAIRRLADPVEILATPMLAIAIVGLLVNVIAFAVLHGGDRDNLNLNAAMLHVLGDLLGSVAAIVAALVILGWGWTQIDPLLSLLVALIVLRGAMRLVRRTGHILLEGSPDDFDVDAMRAALIEEIEDVTDIHHVHAWSLTTERPLVTLHAVVRADADYASVLIRLRALLTDRFGVDHATIQLEPGVKLENPTAK
ncbi:MAG: cation transporter [Rhodospirillales bacterium]|nr:cation transporter [Rhodospirillales bacterium]